MTEDGSQRSRFMSRRTLLALARAAALIILVTGMNGVIAAPPYAPIVAYAIAVLIAGITGGFVVGLIAAVAAIVFYALLFGAPSIVASASILVAAIAGGGIRAFRKVEDSRPRLSGQAGAPVLHPEESQTGLSAVHKEDLEAARNEERTRAASEMNDALQTIHQLHDDLDSARADVDQLRRANLELQEQEREQRTAGGELLGRADTLIAELSAQLERERQGRAADAEDARQLQERLHQQYEAESEHVQSAATRALEEIQRTRSSAEELERELEETRNRLADVTASYEQITEQLATEREHGRTVAGRVVEFQQTLGRAEATRTQLERANEELRRQFEAEVQRLQNQAKQMQEKLPQLDRQWNDKLQKVVNELAADHENDLGEAIAAREQARAEARGLSSRVQELDRKLRESEAARAATPKVDREQIDAEWSARLESVNELAAEHENALGEAVAAREAALAEARSLSWRMQELEQKLRESEAARAATPKVDRDQIDAEWSAKLQKIVNELVADQEEAIGEALERREEARAEVRSLNIRMQELEKKLAAAPKLNREQIDAEWSRKLQDIVAHLAADHEADLGIAIEAREAARAELRSLNQRLISLQQTAEKSNVELSTLRSRLAEAETAPVDDLPFGPMIAPPDMQLPDESDEERRARAEVLQFAEQANAALRRAGSPGDVPLAPRPLILFVHHDPALRNLYVDKLQNNGFRVLTAADGLEGLRLAKTHRPEIVIADTVMPKMDGNELCQLIKSNEETAAAKVVLMTGVFMNEVPNQTEHTFQPDEIVRKPVKFDALKNTLVNLLAAKTA
jgi:CheY-like chemotaxis protein